MAPSRVLRRRRRDVQPPQARRAHRVGRVRGRDHEGREVDEHDVARGEVPGGDEAPACNAAVGDGDVGRQRRRHENSMFFFRAPIGGCFLLVLGDAKKRSTASSSSNYRGGNGEGMWQSR